MKTIALALISLFAAATAAAQPAPIERPEIETVLPHDRSAYTQGLFLRDGMLYESTGGEGRSEIREVRLADGSVQRRAKLPPDIFGEGAVDWGGEIISISWKTGKGYRWDRRTLKLRGTFTYPGEGWGLTRSDSELIMSDGTPQLRFLDPRNFREKRRLLVTHNGKPLPYLNELEWIDGEIWANVWLTNLIARIDPRTGKVVKWMDLAEISAREPSDDPNAVANGIAWDPRSRRVYVTGKNWRALYAIRLPARPRAPR